MPTPLMYKEYFGVMLSEAPGEVKALVEDPPEMLSRPLIIDKEGAIKGIKSGQRSTLLIDELTEKLYKIKGCAPTNQQFLHTPDPIGGQVLSKALQELDRSREMAEIFEEEGLRPAYTPVGYFLYDKEFQTQGRNSERVAASLFEVYGDTRLGEWIASRVPLQYFLSIPRVLIGENWLNVSYPNIIPAYETVPERFQDIIRKFAIWAGAIKRVIDDHGYTWDLDKDDSNVQLGNFVMMGNEEEVYLGVVDLSGCEKWEESQKSTMREGQAWEYGILAKGPTYWRQGFEKGYRNKSPPKITRDELIDAQEDMINAWPAYRTS